MVDRSLLVSTKHGKETPQIFFLPNTPDLWKGRNPNNDQDLI